MAGSGDSVRKLSAFEQKLPLEIRREIYSELLRGEKVLQAPDAYRE